MNTAHAAGMDKTPTNHKATLPARLRAAMRDVFGIEQLRRGQKEVIETVLAGRDTLAIMPAGAGKSLCYQLPGHVTKGATVIVSPLISLMRDQADKLEEAGLEVDQVNSTLTNKEESEALQRIGDAESDFIFATPERMADAQFQRVLQDSAVTLFVIDEAHCISQWGHDFRPAYLALKDVIESLGHPPVLALTATATDEVTRDIVERLGMRNPRQINTGVYRKNIEYGVLPVTSDEDRFEQLLAQDADTDIHMKLPF